MAGAQRYRGEGPGSIYQEILQVGREKQGPKSVQKSNARAEIPLRPVNVPSIRMPALVCLRRSFIIKALVANCTVTSTL